MTVDNYSFVKMVLVYFFVMKTLGLQFPLTVLHLNPHQWRGKKDFMLKLYWISWLHSCRFDHIAHRYNYLFIFVLVIWCNLVSPQKQVSCSCCLRKLLLLPLACSLRINWWIYSFKSLYAEFIRFYKNALWQCQLLKLLCK